MEKQKETYRRMLEQLLLVEQAHKQALCRLEDEKHNHNEFMKKSDEFTSLLEQERERSVVAQKSSQQIEAVIVNKLHSITKLYYTKSKGLYMLFLSKVYLFILCLICCSNSLCSSEKAL